MEAVSICDAFGWKYLEGEYTDQPNWFIDMLIKKRKADAEYEKRRSKSKG